MLCIRVIQALIEKSHPRFAFRICIELCMHLNVNNNCTCNEKLVQNSNVFILNSSVFMRQYGSVNILISGFNVELFAVLLSSPITAEDTDLLSICVHPPLKCPIKVQKLFLASVTTKVAAL